MTCNWTIEDTVKGLEGMILSTKLIEYDFNGIVNIEACEQAIDLLKAQEPRVMTLEEMVEAVKKHDAVFVEECPESREPRCFWGLVVEGIDPPDRGYAYPGGVLFNVINADDDMWDGDFYGLNTALGWRAWTSRPTDEQREAVKWND